MGKIPNEDECPVDNWMNDITNQLNSTFKKMGFTPNGITTLSLIFGLLSAWFLWKGWVWWFAITYMISFFFDCMDGNYARKYKMTSKFGDWYDHIKDGVVAILILVIIVIKFKNRCSIKTWIILISGFVVLTAINLTFVGCQARIHKEGESMNLQRKMCMGDPKKNIKWMRYFGPGTWSIIFVGVILLMEKHLCVDKGSQ